MPQKKPLVLRELFKIKETKVDDFQDCGYFSVSTIKHFREKNSLNEYLQNIALLFSPNPVEIVLENYFPSLVVVYSDSPLGKLVQVFTIYPQNKNTTRTFIPLLTEKSFGIFNSILEPSTIKATEEIIRQDATMLENVYPRFEPKIRLSHEEPLNWVRQLYHSW